MDLSKPQWLPLHPAIVACPTCRTPTTYEAAVQQFQVETAPRYQPKDGVTWCDVFATDVAKAMAAELPHWWLGHELTANDLFDWLEKDGGAYGWEQLPGEHEALAAVQAAMFTIAIWKNPHGHGHVAVLLPRDEVRTAQAGATNFYDRPIADGFGHLTPAYFTCR